MKCRECSCCRKGWFESRPNSYVCIGVKEPFVIDNINVQCTEYPEKNKKNKNIPSENFLMIGFDYSPEDIAGMVVSRGNGKSISVLNTIFGEDAVKLYEQLTNGN